MDVPVLTEVQIEHFLLTNVHDVKLSLVILDKVTQFYDGGKIHECACIASIVFTILQVNAFIATTHKTFIFQVINHERAIMHNFCQRTSPQNIFVWILRNWVTILDLLSNRVLYVTTVALSEDHAENWSPSLTAPIKEIVHEVRDTLQLKQRFVKKNKRLNYLPCLHH